MFKTGIFAVVSCCWLLSGFTPNRIFENRLAGATGEERKKTFSANPLLLNGLPVDYAWFSIQSRGKLSVVEGDPSEPGCNRIPIRVYLRREGRIVSSCQPVAGANEVDLADIMPLAHHGDEFVIEPTRKEDAMAKRVIRLKLFWFFSNTRPGPGC
ncbi:hypothetical protein ACO2Q8_24295 [Larkinella sp. VNQ87]|uniref:hypothetical protein n=1 Tax=Larkinella sp. VNQ87 TaxID=3400921 RepID=UPI003C1298C4